MFKSGDLRRNQWRRLNGTASEVGRKSGDSSVLLSRHANGVIRENGAYRIPTVGDT